MHASDGVNELDPFTARIRGPRAFLGPTARKRPATVTDSVCVRSPCHAEAPTMKSPPFCDQLVLRARLRGFRLNMEWWIWVLAGFALLAFELVSPGGFYVFFFGAGALAVGLLAALGLAETLWLQGVLFTALSVVSLLCFRRPILNKMQARTPAGEVDTLVGVSAVAQSEIGPGERGKVELRGSTWNARNAGKTAVARDQSCVVERVDGLTLWIRAD